MKGFEEVENVSALLRDLPCPWFVCGGWALDLFLGRVTREHKDVDIAVARRDQFEVRDYLRERGWTLEKAIDGELIPWAEGERLELPVHVLWCRNAAHRPDFVEVLLNEFDEGEFRFRRDESVTRGRASMSFVTRSGVPVLAPEIVLLYQSNCHEEHDEDFRSAVGALTEEGRGWLRRALGKLYARHPWAESL